MLVLHRLRCQRQEPKELINQVMDATEKILELQKLTLHLFSLKHFVAVAARAAHFPAR